MPAKHNGETTGLEGCVGFHMEATTCEKTKAWEMVKRSGSLESPGEAEIDKFGKLWPHYEFYPVGKEKQGRF